MERRQRRGHEVSVCGGVWPSRSAFARAMGIKASLFQAYITAWDSADENEIALAVLAARLWHGRDADAETVWRAALELVQERQPEAEIPEGAEAAVELFRRGLRYVEDPGVVAVRWNVEAAGEGQWRFRGEELTWIAVPEEERLECWRDGVMIRKWEQGEFRK